MANGGWDSQQTVRNGNTVRKTRSVTDKVVSYPPYENRRVSDNALLLTGSDGSSVYDQGAESIVYTNSGGQLSNMCLHSRTRTFMIPQTTQDKTFALDGSQSYWLSCSGKYGWAAHSSAVPIAKAALGVNLGSAVLGAGAQGYMNDVCRDVRPDLTTVSVPNFLIEIGQIKDLFKIWKRNLSLSKNVAGGFLNYNFGWKPTIGDITAMVNGIRSLDQRIRDFESACNVLIKKDKLISKDSFTKSGSFTYSSTHKTEWSISYKSKLSGALAFRPQPLAAMSNFEKTLRGLLDTLGFQLDPRIIWDEIPFSFVIDWFFGVGNWLSNFSIDTLSLPISYVDGYLTYKEELTIESNTILNVYNANYSPKARCLGVVTVESFFQRMPILPDFATLSGLGLRNPTGHQWQELLALGTVLGGR